MNAPDPNFVRKDASIAVLLSFLWTGAGQVYAGSITGGIILICINFFFFLLALGTGGGFLCISFPFWVWGMFNAASQAREHNERYGPARNLPS